MKKLLLGVTFIVLVGFGGFFYRNAMEYSTHTIACPVEKFVCPDGTALSHVGVSCSFPACPPPNVSMADVGIAFALPAGFTPATAPDTSVSAAYETSTVSPAEKGSIFIHRYSTDASSTASATIQKTAIAGASGLPISPTAFTSTELNNRRFTVVTIERFEGVVDVAYYLTRATDVLRFDAIDRGVDWTNPNLDITTLPTQVALRQLLGTLQAE